MTGIFIDNPAINCKFTLLFLLTQQKSYQEPIDKEFQRRYASVVLELERLNKVSFGVFVCFLSSKVEHILYYKCLCFVPFFAGSQ